MAKKQKIFVDGVEVVLTREAAEMIGVSMTHMRMLGRKGIIKPVLTKERAVFYPVTEVKRYKADKAAGRKAGRVPGPEPRGFSES
jgi:predicted site-specific integrase-resolvase